MEITITLLSILHVLVSILLILIVLWQRPRQEGLGVAFGSGMTDQMFGAQTTNVLQKGTVYLAVFFFLNTIVIATLMASRTKAAGQSDLLNETKEPAAQVQEVPAIPVPIEPETAPAGESAPDAAVPAAPGDQPEPAPEAAAEESAAPTEENP